MDTVLLIILLSLFLYYWRSGKMSREMVKLLCSQDEFEEMHERLSVVRASTEHVKVDRMALQRLLIDHSNLLKRVPHETAPRVPRGE